MKVNQEMLQFYWELGQDIVIKKAESRWGSGFMKNLSRDLKAEYPDAKCFSQTNLLYMNNFYLLYKAYLQITPQVGEQMESPITQQVVEQMKQSEITPQVVEQIHKDVFSVPRGHHKQLIDKFKDDPEKIEDTIPSIEEIEAKLNIEEDEQTETGK